MEINYDNLKYVCGECSRGLSAKGCGRQDHQLNTYDWLADVPGNTERTDLVEVQFKNTRKGYYHNINELELKKGDLVAVESSPGHDIGVVTLTGQLVNLQVRKANLKSMDDIKRVYRIAREQDIKVWEEAKSREHATMIQSRQIAKDLGLQMKIGDVEYQGDGNKAIFYYIADERVDFRQLIKVLADVFHVRIEMKQIGARQEAGLIGGIGICGRELCCARFITNFQSISTSAARIQDLSLNQQKLQGQCGKLKCCLNYEVANYADAMSRIPKVSEPLEFEDGPAYLMKTDILQEIMYFSYEKGSLANLYPLTAEEVREVIMMNRNGEKPESLKVEVAPQGPQFISAVGDDSITRFDKPKKSSGRGRGRRRPGKDARPRQGEANNREDAPKSSSEDRSAARTGSETRNGQEGSAGRDRRDRRRNPRKPKSETNQ